MKRKPPRIPDDVRAEIIHAKDRGLTNAAIALEYGCSPQAVSVILRAAGRERLRTSAADRLRAGTLALGARSLASVLIELPPDVVNWLSGTAGKQSIAARVREIIKAEWGRDGSA